MCEHEPPLSSSSQCESLHRDSKRLSAVNGLSAALFVPSLIQTSYTMPRNHCPKAKVSTVVLRAVLSLVSLLLVVAEFPATKLLAVEPPSMDGILDTELPV